MEKKPPIGIFWDLENCQIPSECAANAVVMRVRQEFGAKCAEVEFLVVCDVTKQRQECLNALNNAQVTIVHVTSTAKNAADEKLKCALRKFGNVYQSPGTVLLISGDINFVPELYDLRFRCGFDIGVIHNAAADPLLDVAHRTLQFASVLPSPQALPRPAQHANSPALAQSCCVEVANLPALVASRRIRARLSQLSANCGGRVVALRSVPYRAAVLKFPSPQDADRALPRLHQEDAFGCKLWVRKCTDLASPAPARRFRHPSSSSGICSREPTPPQRVEDDSGGEEEPATSTPPKVPLNTAHYPNFLGSHVRNRFDFKPMAYALDTSPSTGSEAGGSETKKGRRPSPPTRRGSQGTTDEAGDLAEIRIQLTQLDTAVPSVQIRATLQTLAHQLDPNSSVKMLPNAKGKKGCAEVTLSTSLSDNKVEQHFQGVQIGTSKTEAQILSSSPVPDWDSSASSTSALNSSRSTPLTRRRRRLAAKFATLV